MSARVIVIRPEPGCSATVERARALGLEAGGFPLSTVRAVDWAPPSPAAIDALLLGSANAVRHGGEHLRAFAGKPVYAVGSATAQAAREVGLEVAATGEGGLQALLDGVPARPLRLLRLAGDEHVPVSPPAGVSIDTRVVYASEFRPLPAELVSALRDEGCVLLHSAASARHLAAECDRLGLPRDAIRLIALGPRIAAAAGTGWRQVHVSATPDEAALLALAHDLCHEPRSGRTAPRGAPQGPRGN